MYLINFNFPHYFFSKGKNSDVIPYEGKGNLPTDLINR
jgi:hypothetical protein